MHLRLPWSSPGSEGCFLCCTDSGPLASAAVCAQVTVLRLWAPRHRTLAAGPCQCLLMAIKEGAPGRGGAAEFLAGQECFACPAIPTGLAWRMCLLLGRLLGSWDRPRALEAPSAGPGLSGHQWELRVCLSPPGFRFLKLTEGLEVLLSPSLPPQHRWCWLGCPDSGAFRGGLATEQRTLSPPEQEGRLAGRPRPTWHSPPPVCRSRSCSGEPFIG